MSRPVPRLIVMPRPFGGGFDVPQDVQEGYIERGYGRGGVVGGVASSQSAATPRVLSMFPPDVVPPKTSVTFQPYAQATTNVAGQVLVLWSFTIPSSAVLVIKSLDLYVNSVVAATDITFGIYVDDIPWEGYGEIPIFPLPGAGLAKSFNDQTWRFPETKTVTCRVTNTDGGTHLVGSGAQGWYYNKAIDNLFNIGY